MRIDFDAAELDRLAADLKAAPERLKPEVDRIVERAALNIRRDAQQRVRDQIRGVYLPHYPRAITYDMDFGGSHAEAEIGPESGLPQGGMGPGVEFGSARHAPIPHLLPAYDDELPRLIEHLADATERVLR